jgi:hypothetical protein
MTIADLAYQHALDQLAEQGFAALSERERDLAVLWQVESGLSNGGFRHYYSGASGDLAFLAPAALTRVGATEKAGIVRAAHALFGPAGPPRDRQHRLAALAGLSIEAGRTLDELERRYAEDPADVDELVERSAATARSGA